MYVFCCLDLVSESLSAGSCVLDISHPSWSTPLLSGSARFPKLFLYFLSPSAKISHSTKTSGSFLWRMVFRNQDMFSATGMSLLLGSLSGRSQKIMYTYIQKCEICFYFYISLYMYAYIHSSRMKALKKQADLFFWIIRKNLFHAYTYIYIYPYNISVHIVCL